MSIEEEHKEYLKPLRGELAELSNELYHLINSYAQAGHQLYPDGKGGYEIKKRGELKFLFGGLFKYRAKTGQEYEDDKRDVFKAYNLIREILHIASKLWKLAGGKYLDKRNWARKHKITNYMYEPYQQVEISIEDYEKDKKALNKKFGKNWSYDKLYNTRIFIDYDDGYAKPLEDEMNKSKE